MPNIMLTYRCNLKCSYCFANEFVNKENIDITEENFDKAIAFLTKDNSTRIGLIGGEPTIHPKFKNILDVLINNHKVEQVTVYTNGLEIDKYTNQLITSKIKLLINCNSPENIGKSNYEKMVKNIDNLIFNHYMKDRVNLGINLYSNDMNYDYIISLLKRYNMHRVRISLTVPDFSNYKCNSILKSFEERKEFLLFFLKKLTDENILPYYDCNKPPFCIWDEQEKKEVKNIVSKFGNIDTNLVGNKSFCYPVIDILPDLRAVRCFGMSDFLKVNILDFDNITELASFFLNEIDAFAYHIYKDENCSSCKLRKTRQCTIGCIGFKEKEIKEIKDHISYINLKQSNV